MEYDYLHWVIWHITNKCNLECTYCYPSSGPRAEEQLSESDLFKIVEEINKTRSRVVTIIGGEPFTVDCLPEIIEALLTVPGREVNIDTNATYLQTRWNDVYYRVNRINLSIDSLDSQVHNEQRGAYKGVLDAIEFLSQKRVPFGGNITVTSSNFATIKQTAEFLLQKGASVVGFGKVKPIGRGLELFPKVRLTPVQLKEATRQIIEFYLEHHKEAKILASGFYDPELFEQGPVNKLPSCLCGDAKVTINFDGMVYPCEAMPYLLIEDAIKAYGEPMNILEYPLDAIMDSPLMRAWREIVYTKPSDCTSCRYQLYCSGGCRAFNLFSHGNPLRKDPNCKIGTQVEPLVQMF